MTKYIKEFLLRGIFFGGFGPIILGIIMLVLHYAIEVTVTGADIFVGIISTYLLAFVHAGASIFNQIEKWSVGKSLLVHLSCLYVVYLLCYLINSWIAFDPVVILIFTLIFLVIYFTVWLIVYICVKHTTKNLNKKILKK